MQLKKADHKYINILEPICTQDITIPPNDRPLFTIHPQLDNDTAVTGILQPSDAFTEDGDIAVCSPLVTLTQRQVIIQVNKFTDHPYTRKGGSHIANFLS